MLETAYIITWREVDGSGSGATSAFTDKSRAEFLLRVLRADVTSRKYRLETVPFDAVPAGAAVPAVCKSPDCDCPRSALGPLCRTAADALGVDAEALATAAAPKTKRQYYYSCQGCKAVNSTDADCICWHDEGTGPATSLAPEMLEWREVPAC